jgi:glycosyltransferase involved in cell wall biosynthesis
VADNDAAGSAKAIVDEFAAGSTLRTVYCVEPEQNIARARNKAISCSEGDFIAFIDDDEVPTHDWLASLLAVAQSPDVSGVLGPVKPRFDCEPPVWILRGGFFDRPSHPTGHVLDWSETRTGNVLFRSAIVAGQDAFRAEFGTGSEDVDFFRRMTDRGHVFVWCDQAPVYESVPSSRCRAGYLLRRALVRGSTFPSRGTNLLRSLVTSLTAVPVYTLSLSVFAVLGRHVLVRYLIKLFDHFSRICAFIGLPLVRERHL